MTKRMFFTRDEVVIHNSRDDIWVIINGTVIDLTIFFRKRVESDSVNDCLNLLLAYAGKDLSWCFNEQNFPIFRVNQYGYSIPKFPPVNEKESHDSDYWWNDEKNIIGHVTCLERRLRIVNTLTRKKIVMNVCDEDSINVIKEKYKKRFNSNADNYIWRKTHSSDTLKIGHLFMDKTLTQNGILYHEHEKLGLPSAIWLFYNS
ncbi:unnamed protein product [Chironomus riparius]|uniref:Cytochrome b5 domain-containing protein 1 n=1 Tax=Chironomus riparius TaxID=315576 RepID=A0A9N9RNS8_9DIPT|nr:unnamed protein product [Chironomus riparius]